VFPDSLEMPADVENAGRRELRLDTAGGARWVTAIYPLAAWRPGEVELPAATVLLRSLAGTREVQADFAPFHIESVLPADTAGIEPKPLRDVFGANRVWWPILLALLLLLLLLVALWIIRRRRRPAQTIVLAPARPPREVVLEELDRIRALGLVEAGDVKVFYTLVSDALRRYVATIEPAWSQDLTTTELSVRMRAQVRADQARRLLAAPAGSAGVAVAAPADAGIARLIGILGSADLVKFARRRPQATEALTEWGAARRWAESFDWPPAAPQQERAA
jgi:hypothetical protein